MKALKHSPEWPFPQRYPNDLVITPFGLMTSLHVHVKGYDKTGRCYEAHSGNGPETFFYVMPGDVTQAQVERKAKHLVGLYINDYRLNSDGSLHEPKKKVFKNRPQE